MSVVAGCSLFDGVLLAADCRATVRYRNQPDIYSDNVLKVFAIHPNTAIAFVGDIDMAAHLIGQLMDTLKNRNRKEKFLNFAIAMVRVNGFSIGLNFHF